MLVQTLWIGVLAGAAALIVNLAIAKIVVRLTNTPASFAPFTLLPIASGCFAGPLTAAFVLYALRLVTGHPQVVFTVVAALALLASFHLPFRLTDHRSARFAGATLPVQLTLCLMHTVVAAFSVLALLRFAL